MATNTETAVTAVVDDTPVSDKERERFRTEAHARGERFPDLEPGELDEMIRLARKDWQSDATK
jgi:hypothetical protein